MQRRSFALVLTLFLVALLAATGAGMALTAAVESVLMGQVAREIAHRLAVDSFLVCFPALLREGRERSFGPGEGAPHTMRLALDVGDVQVECEVAEGGERIVLKGAASSESLQAQLRERARRHGLPEENIDLRPIVESDSTRGWPRFVWFDQVVSATEFEEIFRWEFPARETTARPARRTWSDLLSFWQTAVASESGGAIGVGGSGSLRFLEIETRYRRERRRWFVVVSIRGDEVQVVHRESV